MAEKYSLTPTAVEQIISYIKSGEIAIPEIQRPFVWKRSQVRDLIDSLYNGYPTGYIITWKNPDVHTKDGGNYESKNFIKGNTYEKGNQFRKVI